MWGFKLATSSLLKVPFYLEAAAANAPLRGPLNLHQTSELLAVTVELTPATSHKACVKTPHCLSGHTSVRVPVSLIA